MLQTFKTRAKYGAAVLSSSLLSFAAFAQTTSTLPSAVKTQTDAAQSNVSELGGIFLIIAVIIAAFAWMKRGAR